jgi:VCBS repeat-containing protein
LNADGSFSYTPAAGYSGPDSFSYFASDGSAGTNSTSSPVTVSLSVRSINHEPVATADSFEVNEDATLVAPSGGAPGVLANDSDSDGDVLMAILATGPLHGTLSLSADGSFTYTPVANFNGADLFSYRASDGQTSSAPATVTITIHPINDAPLAVDDTNYVTSENVPLDVPAAAGVLANDLDADGNALTAVLVSTTTNGTLTLNASGAFIYASVTAGVDHFTYRAYDGTTTSQVATVTITVLPANSGPLAQNDSYATDEDIALVLPAPGVLANDSDADGNSLSAVLAGGPTHGTLSLNNDGSFIYSPESNFSGNDSFSYRASDGTTNSSIAIVSLLVRPVNDAPVLAHIGDKSVTKGNLLTFTAWATDVDASQSLAFSLDAGAPAGANINASSGVFTWMPLDVSGPSTNFVTVRVTDNGSPALSAAETFAIVVNEVIHVSISDVTVPGGSAGNLEAVFEVNLSSPSSETVSVDFATADGTALANADYVPATGTLIFPPGVTNQSIEVTVNGNSAATIERTFFVNLFNANPQGGTVIDDNEGIATIGVEAAGGLAINDVSMAEGDAGLLNAMFTVSLHPPSDRVVTVRYAALKGSATALKDFRPKRGVLKFLPGTTSQTVALPVVGDRLSESNETFTVNLSKSVNAVIARGQGSATIMDNDPLPDMTIADAIVTEPNVGTRFLNFTVRLSARSGRLITVDFATADGTATADEDYVPASGTLIFPPNVTKRRIVIALIGDRLNEDNETFVVNLTNAVNANIADGQAIGVIANNDPLPRTSGDARPYRQRVHLRE